MNPGNPMKFKVTPLQAQAQVSTCYVIRTYMIYLLYTDIALRLFNIAMEHHHFNRYIIYFVLWLIFQFAMLNNQRVYNIYIYIYLYIYIYTYIHTYYVHPVTPEVPVMMADWMNTRSRIWQVPNPNGLMNTSIPAIYGNRLGMVDPIVLLTLNEDII